MMSARRASHTSTQRPMSYCLPSVLAASATGVNPDSNRKAPHAPPASPYTRAAPDTAAPCICPALHLVPTHLPTPVLYHAAPSPRHCLSKCRHCSRASCRLTRPHRAAAPVAAYVVQQACCASSCAACAILALHEALHCVAAMPGPLATTYKDCAAIASAAIAVYVFMCKLRLGAGSCTSGACSCSSCVLPCCSTWQLSIAPPCPHMTGHVGPETAMLCISQHVPTLTT
jgi:hypothetical protein